MKKTLAALALCAAVVSPAQATIVDHGDYLTDTATGLDWLDVTKSVNMSFNYVSKQFGAGGLFAGWRYATGKEFNGLIGSYTGTAPNTYDRVNQEPDKIDGLSALLGSTLDSAYLNRYGMTYDARLGVPEGSGMDYTAGILADSISFEYKWVAFIGDDDTSSSSPDFTSAHHTSAYYTTQFAHVGFFLTRQQIVQPAIHVPEPSTVALLGLGLLGFAASRRKAKRK